MKEGTTSNLRRHLMRIHKIDVDELDKKVIKNVGVESTEKKEAQLSFYATESMPILRALLYNIIKDKLSINIVNGAGY